METRRVFGKQMLVAGAGALASQVVPPSLGAQAKPEFTGAGSLKTHAAARGLYFGASVDVPSLDRDPEYARTIAEQCNIVVAESAMKWAPLRPAPERFDFTGADRLMAFARDHGIAVRGHTLCWHKALPDWFAATVNKGNAEQYLSKHITAVVGRYKGKIRSWDVVNEAIELKDGQPSGFRSGPWYKLLGPEFIEIAFRAARAADPAALLTYNDYGLETDGKQETLKREAVLTLLRGMKQKGVPIDAVGLQSHLSADSAAQIGNGLSEFVAKLQTMGLKVFLTELDVNDDSIMSNDLAARQKAVATIYGSYVGSMLKHRAVTDVLTWGVRDSYSWLNGPDAVKFRPKYPLREEVCLPFDDAYQPQPAFYALRAALDSRSA